MGGAGNQRRYQLRQASGRLDRRHRSLSICTCGRCHPLPLSGPVQGAVSNCPRQAAAPGALAPAAALQEAASSSPPCRACYFAAPWRTTRPASQTYCTSIGCIVPAVARRARSGLTQPRAQTGLRLGLLLACGRLAPLGAGFLLLRSSAPLLRAGARPGFLAAAAGGTGTVG